MSRNRTWVITWRTLSRLIILTFAVAMMLYASAVLVAAVSFYRSTQQINAQDVKTLEELSTKLDNSLQNQGTLSAARATINQKNQELKDTISRLRKANAQVEVTSSLDTISANLSLLSEQINNEQSRAAEAVAQLKTKVTEIKNKVEPPDALDKIIGTFIRESGKILLAIIWPLLVVVLFLYLLNSHSAPELLRKLFSPFKSVKLFEAELVLSDEAKTLAEGTFENYRKQAIQNYDLFIQRKKLVEKFENAVNDGIAGVLYRHTGNKPIKYRCALHVPDLVFADTLYQLLDYHPRGAGKGRIFSIRFGIIGRVWRSRSSEIQKFPLTMREGKQVVDEDELVRSWGMSKREAQTAAEGRPAFLCVMLRTEEDDPVGLFYMDSIEPTTFDVDVSKEREEDQERVRKNKTQEMLKQICDELGKRKIIDILAQLSDELGGRAPLIRVYEK